MARRNISQAALAEKLKQQVSGGTDDRPLKITQQKLSRCVSGQQAFRVDELQMVADALDVPMATLLGDERVSA